MSWLRLDDKFARHPKVVGLSDRAFRVHVIALLYCAEYGTRGSVASSAYKAIGATASIRKTLVKAGLWDEGPDGLEIHDFERYNPHDSTAAERMRRLRASRKFANTGRTNTEQEANGSGDVLARAPWRPRAARPVLIEPPTPLATNGARTTLCPACKVRLDYDPPTGDLIPQQRLAGWVAAHLVNVHDWEEDRAADVAAKTIKEAR